VDEEDRPGVDLFKLLDGLASGLFLVARAAGSLVPHTLQHLDAPEDEQLDQRRKYIEYCGLCDQCSDVEEPLRGEVGVDSVKAFFFNAGLCKVPGSNEKQDSIVEERDEQDGSHSDGCLL
jgi:hypothetical protein